MSNANAMIDRSRAACDPVDIAVNRGLRRRCAGLAAIAVSTALIESALTDAESA